MSNVKELLNESKVYFFTGKDNKTEVIFYGSVLQPTLWFHYKLGRTSFHVQEPERLSREDLSHIGVLAPYASRNQLEINIFVNSLDEYSGSSKTAPSPADWEKWVRALDRFKTTPAFHVPGHRSVAPPPPPSANSTSQKPATPTPPPGTIPKQDRGNTRK